MIALARQKRLFLMEGMWTRYFPIVRKIRSLMAEGALGCVLLLEAEFHFRATFDPDHRLYNPTLGGGALLDLGVYPVSLASMVFGEPPREIVSRAWLGATGVDEQAAVILSYSEGRQAVLSFGFRFDSPQEVNIVGETGRIRIHKPWWHPEKATWTKADGQEELLTLPTESKGFNYEAREVTDCIRAGRLESEDMPLDETLEIMRTLDAVRSPWGLRYPADARPE
jgi:predicted dehydrogenase